jgi:hypothetical protein
LDEALKFQIEKIRNYFSNRIEGIKEGKFVPYYDKVKNLPEFSGINQDAFIIARNGWFKQTFHMSHHKWYNQNFHMTISEYSSRLASNLSVEGTDGFDIQRNLPDRQKSTEPLTLGEKLITLLYVCVISGGIGGSIGASILGEFGFFIGFGLGFFAPIFIMMEILFTFKLNQL